MFVCGICSDLPSFSYSQGCIMAVSICLLHTLHVYFVSSFLPFWSLEGESVFLYISLGRLVVGGEVLQRVCEHEGYLTTFLSWQVISEVAASCDRTPDRILLVEFFPEVGSVPPIWTTKCEVGLSSSREVSLWNECTQTVLESVKNNLHLALGETSFNSYY